jgi:hypothetical protein
MSLPCEKMRAVRYAEEFLDDLWKMRNKDIAKDATALKKRALRVLHHWPMIHEYQAMMRGLYRADPAGAEVSDEIELLVKEFTDGFSRRWGLSGVQGYDTNTGGQKRQAQKRVRRVRRKDRDA